MTSLLERAIDVVRVLPPDAQDEIARLVLRFAGDTEAIIPMSAKEEESFSESLAQSKRGEFATDEQVSAVWEKAGL